MNRLLVLTALLVFGSAGFAQDTQTPPTTGPGGTPDLSQYRVQALDFEGNRAFSSEQLTNTFHVPPGEKFNHTAVGQGLERLRSLYADHGYINFVAAPMFQVDRSRRTVVLTLSVDEGAQFTFGRLFLVGQEPHAGQADALRNSWAALSGKVYDASLLCHWLDRNATFLPADGQRCRQVGVELHQHIDTRHADITIAFPGPKS